MYRRSALHTSTSRRETWWLMVHPLPLPSLGPRSLSHNRKTDCCRGAAIALLTNTLSGVVQYERVEMTKTGRLCSESCTTHWTLTALETGTTPDYSIHRTSKQFFWHRNGGRDECWATDKRQPWVQKANGRGSIQLQPSSEAEPESSSRRRPQPKATVCTPAVSWMAATISACCLASPTNLYVIAKPPSSPAAPLYDCTHTHHTAHSTGRSEMLLKQTSRFSCSTQFQTTG